jgi:murein DD-endopeptidase MepM/ murein hydrolase activator NlpD
MAEPTKEQTPATPPNAGDSSKAQGAAGQVDALLARVTGGRIPLRWARVAGVAVLVIVAALAFFVMRNFAAGIQQQQQESLHATAVALAMPTIEAVTGGQASALMPLLSDSTSPFLEGIPRQASLDTIIPSRTRDNIETYTVVQGDSLFALAERYGVRAESLLWFNFNTLRDNPNFLEPGQVLNIPPVDGVLHTYRTGETLASIADFYSYSTDTTAQEILEWPGNNLDPYETDPNNPNIPDGSQIVVPNGSRELTDWGPPAISRDNPAVAAYYGPGSCGAIGEGAVGVGSFVWPSVNHYLSGFDYNPPLHSGIDLAGAEGTPVYAVDGGVVVYAGWSNSGYGNLLVIDHGTGWQSAYAHLNAVAVTCGQNVSQGGHVGAIGNTGNSSGAHLHFELLSFSYGKVNPWDWLP